MAINEELTRRLRQAREQDEAEGLNIEEAHADLPLLPPLPKAPGEVVVIFVPARPGPRQEG